MAQTQTSADVAEPEDNLDPDAADSAHAPAKGDVAGAWDDTDAEVDAVRDDEAEDDDGEDDAGVEAEADAALDELESEELEMLTEDEASETLVVDEARELRAIQRAELSLAENAGGGRSDDEFQCQSCFLVLKNSQLAEKRTMYCFDCAG